MIKIHMEGQTREDCRSMIVVPEKALTEAGYIQTITDGSGSTSKHEFQAMAQTAYFQYQDDELDVEKVFGNIKVEARGERVVNEKALFLFRDADGAFHCMVHADLPVKKLLEAAYRFCTRWVRLDI